MGLNPLERILLPFFLNNSSPLLGFDHPLLILSIHPSILNPFYHPPVIASTILLFTPMIHLSPRLYCRTTGTQLKKKSHAVLLLGCLQPTSGGDPKLSPLVQRPRHQGGYILDVDAPWLWDAE